MVLVVVLTGSASPDKIYHSRIYHSRKFRGAAGQSQIRLGPTRNIAVDGCASARSSPMYQGARLFCSGPPCLYKDEPTELAYIDILVNLKMRLVSVKRMTQIQNIS